jgi:SET domain-containing protein
MYKPLPIYLTIKSSDIEGLGLFTNTDIDANFRIGLTHIKDYRFENGYSRTPLGGFFNHSSNPNCKVIYEGDFIFLETIGEIKAGEEITVKYTFYNPSK